MQDDKQEPQTGGQNDTNNQNNQNSQSGNTNTTQQGQGNSSGFEPLRDTMERRSLTQENIERKSH